MKQRIPREVLWKDRNTMEGIMNEPVFKVLHEAFLYFEREPMLFPMDELTILNEVGYQVTWMCFESRYGLEPDMDYFFRDVFARTGLIDHAMTVISLVQAVVMLVNFPPLNISKRTKRELLKLSRDSWCRRYVDALIKRVLSDGTIFEEQFLPCQSDYKITYEEETSYQSDYAICAEPTYEEQHTRTFTLDDIVNYAKQNLSLDKSALIQNMLFNLLMTDGTREEMEKVASIPEAILKRDAKHQIGQVIAQQNNLGDPHWIAKLTNKEKLKELLSAL